MLETVLLAALIFFGARLVIQNFRVDGPSMTPTLIDAQFLLVNKLAYLNGSPKRGDIVVFRSPRNPDEDLVKRVIGLPGETVEIRSDGVYVNGQRLDETAYYREITGPPMSAIQVPGEHYFVMGDNRSQSRDSRAIGTVPSGAIVGQVWLVYWPPSSFGPVEIARPALEPAPERAAA